MQKVMRGSVRIVSWVMAIGFVLILLASVPALFRGGWALLLALPALGFLLAVRRLLERMRERDCHRVFLAGLLLFTAGVYLLGIALEQLPAWDFGRVYRAAKELSENGRFVNLAIQEYFGAADNNFFVTVYLSGWFSLLGSIGVYPTDAGLILNALSIGLSVLFTYLAFCCAGRTKEGFLTAAYCFFFAPMLLYAPIYYTDTLSMPFVCLALWMAVKAQKHGGVRGIFRSAAAGGSAAVGYLIKATPVILLAALILAWFLFPQSESPAFSRGRKRTRDVGVRSPRRVTGRSWRASARNDGQESPSPGGRRKGFFWLRRVLPAAAALLAFFAAVGGWAVYRQNMRVFIDDPSFQIVDLPPSHYVMMGLRGNGGYSPEDASFSLSFPTEAERRAANGRVIRERIAEYGFFGMFRHLQGKTAYTWGDGGYYAPQKIAVDPVSGSPLLEWFREGGAGYPAVSAVLSAGQLLLLVLLASGAVRGARSRSPDPLLFAVRAAVMGLALFLTVWETRSRYLVNFAPLLAALAADEVGRLSDGLRRIFPRKGKGQHDKDI